VAGIDMHIGSQITELEPFEKAFRLMGELTESADGAGPQHPPPRLRAVASAFPIAAPTTFRRTRTNMPPW
jgi:hypothetical protein